MPICPRSIRRVHLMALAGTVFGLSAPAMAQTWNGGSAIDSNWTTAANWTALPANNGSANVIFSGLNRTSVVVNVAQDVNSVAFSNTAGIFNIGGASVLTVRAGGITNNNTQAESLSCPVTALVSQTWSATSGPLNMSGALIISNPLTLECANGVTFAGPTSGNGSITKNGPGVWLLSGASSSAGGFLLNGGTLRLGASNVLPDSGLINIVGSAVLDVNGATDSVGSFGSVFPGTQVQLPGNSSLTFGGANVSSNFAGTIAGAATATLTKVGTGTATFTGSSTFAGTVAVQGGVLALGSSERLADVCNVVVNGASAVLSVPSGFTETVNQMTVLNGGTLTGSGTISVNSGYVVGAGSTTCNLAGFGGFLKSSPGDFAISSPALCTFSGNVDLTSGRLLLNRQNCLPVTSVNLSAGSVLQLGEGIQQSVRQLSGDGSVVLGSSFAGTILTVGNDSFLASNFNGVISGAGGLTKAGNSGFSLSGANAYTGTTRISAGILYLFGAADRLPTATPLIIDGGSLSMGPVNQTVQSLQLISGSVTTDLANPATLTASNFDLRSGTIDAQLAGPGELQKNSSGRVTLTRPNSYSGGTRLTDGVLDIPTDAALGPTSGPITVNGNATLRINQGCTISRPIVFLVGALNLDLAADVTLNSALSAGAFIGKVGTGRLVIGVGTTLSGFVMDGGEIFVPTGVQLATLQSAGTNAGGTLRVDGTASILGSGGYGNSGTLALGAGSRFNSPALLNSGVLSGSGTINAPLSNSLAGDVRVGADGSMLFTATTAQTSAGLIEVRGGSLEFAGPLTNASSTGLIFARDATLRFNAGLTNAGSIALSFGTTDIFGDINNLAGGVITVTGASDANFLDDVINNGTFRTSAGGATVFLGALSGSGSFPGTGTVYMEGDLRPGNSPGLMTFGGDLVLGSFAALDAELAGEDPAQYDRVIVAGTATLDGTLAVHSSNGFSLDGTGIHHFPVVEARTIVGRFVAVAMPAPLASLRVRYTGTAVILTTCAADFNLDGTLDPDDLADYISVFFAAPPGAGSDFNNDGGTDPDDLADFISAFFEGCA